MLSITSSEQFSGSNSAKDHHHHHHRRRQREYSIDSSSQPTTGSVDEILQNQDNDWFFEKLLRKFESLRGESPQISSARFDDFPGERIVERRYYVKKSKSNPKSNQLTSTSDLTRFTQDHHHHHHHRKSRQYSAVSSVPETTISSCSECSSSASTPSYIEQIRQQSESLQKEIRILKNEIEQLHASQDKFFAQFKTQSFSKAESTISSQTYVPSSIVPAVPKKSPSPSASESEESVETSRNTTPVNPPVIKSNGTPSNVSAASGLPPISEFSATRYSSMQSAGPVISSNKPPSQSVVSTPVVSEFTASKHSSVAPTPITIPQERPRIPSIMSNRTTSEFVGSRHSSIAPTPPAIPTRPLIAIPVPLIAPSMSSRRDSTASEESQTESVQPASTNANGIHDRRVLSPRSQIVASSYGFDTDESDGSSGSSSPSQDVSNQQEPVKTPPLSLGTMDMHNLAQYSSQLETTGFRPMVNHVIRDPNRSSSFWNAVDDFIEINGIGNSRNTILLRSQTQYGSSPEQNLQSHQQLDKYDLEIRGQEFIASSAPLLLPPLDILP